MAGYIPSVGKYQLNWKLYYGVRNPKKKLQMRIVVNSAPKTWDSPWSTIRRKKIASGIAAKIVADFITASSNHLLGAKASNQSRGRRLLILCARGQQCARHVTLFLGSTRVFK